MAQLGSAPDWGSGGRRFKSCRPDVTEQRIITIPNFLSALRLLGVPVFFWYVVKGQDTIAIALLFFAGLSDYLDGKIARRFNQFSRLGTLLDPLADRFYILATLVGFSIRNIVPWWFAGLLLGRDLLLALSLPVLKRLGYGPLPVSFLGKSATFSLLYAFPVLLIGEGSSLAARLAHPIGWAFAIWGAGLYLITGVHYLLQVQMLRSKSMVE